MVYPTKYNRQYDYSSYQNANPTRPLPGDKVNVDLNGVKQSVGEIVDFLKGALSSDGHVADGSVGLRQLSPGLQLGLAAVDVVTGLVAEAENAADAAQAFAVSAGQAAGSAVSAALVATSRAAVETTTFLPGVRKILTLGYAVQGDGGDMPLVRVDAQPSHLGRVRALDRYLADGVTIDLTNGGWFAIDLNAPGLELNPKMFGAPNDGTSYDDAAFAALTTVAQLGICRNFLFTGNYKLYPPGTKPAAAAFGITGVDNVTCRFDKAVFNTVVAQNATFSGVGWAVYLFGIYGCKNFRGIGRPKFTGSWTFAQIKVSDTGFGTIGIAFIDNCSGFKIDGADGEGVLCPVTVFCDVSRVNCVLENPIVSAGGTGYVNGDVVRIDGANTGWTAPTFTAAVTGGAITGLFLSSVGDFPDGTLPDPGGYGYALSGGTGTGGRVIAYMERNASVAQHTVGGDLGYINAFTCYYGFNSRDSGDFMTGTINAEYCFRGCFAYGGVIGARLWVTLRHIYRTGMPFGGGFHALGNKDCEYHLTVLPYTDSNAASGDILCRPSFDGPFPTRVSMKLTVDLQYNFYTTGAPGLMEFGKYNGGVGDSNPRGHELNLEVNGRIRGIPTYPGFVGKHITMVDYPWTGDFFSMKLSLDIKDGGIVQVHPAPFTKAGTGLHIDISNPRGYVCVNGSSGNTTEYLSYPNVGNISVSPRSDYLNRNASNATAPATAGCVDTAADITLAYGWHNFVVKCGAGSGSTTLRTLPAAPRKGQRYTVMNTATNAGTVVRIVPPTGFNFIGHAATKYLELAIGASATVECIQATALGDANDSWVVVSSSGTLTYQA